MKKYFILILSIVLNFIFYNNIFSAMANPKSIELKQPDGTKINVRIYGDEFYNWYEDEKGYTIIKDTTTKFWSYAEKDSFGNLRSSTNFVGKINPDYIGIRKSLIDENKIYKAKSNRQSLDLQLQKTLALYTSSNTVDGIEKFSQQKASAIGTKTNFVLLVQFNDLKFKDNPPFSSSSTDEQIRAEFNDLFNKTKYTKDGAVGSVKDYFKEISYGQLQYNSVISPVITIDQSYTYYSYSADPTHSRVQELIKTALKQLDDSGYNFKDIWPSGSTPEGFTIIHAGGGAENGNTDFIWSHKSSLIPYVTYDGITFSNYHIEASGRGTYGDEGLIRIGVICHESLHFFGLPDLYDTYYTSAGLGEFCIMAAGEWNGNLGNCPAHPCAWCKKQLGWINYQSAIEGENTIGQSAVDKEAFYKFSPSTFNSKEYFIMENKQSIGFDKYIPGTKKGLLIYHIDERKYDNDDPTHYLVDIEEADGSANWINDHLAKSRFEKGRDSDYFRNNTVSIFNDECTSSPNSKSYTGQISNIKISVISKSSSLMSFVYGKDIPTPVTEDLDQIVCYPNPARQGYTYISNIPIYLDEFSIEIFTMTSKLVKSFSVDDIAGSIERKVKWDCKNENGEDVAPGVYMVLIKNGSKKKIFKIAVIR